MPFFVYFPSTTSTLFSCWCIFCPKFKQSFRGIKQVQLFTTIAIICISIWLMPYNMVLFTTQVWTQHLNTYFHWVHIPHKVIVLSYLFELKLNSYIISSINIEVLHMVPQFHTGMSSLQNLKNLPLKGDKTYVITQFLHQIISSH